MKQVVFTVLSFQLSHEAGLAEEECEQACTLNSCTVHTRLQAFVTDAPTHSRWLKSCQNRVPFDMVAER